MDNTEKKMIRKNFEAYALNRVELRNVQVAGGKTIPGYKTVYDLDAETGVSVVSNKYNLLTNEEIVNPVLNFLDKENIKYEFDEFTYSSPTRMRMHLSFPDLKIKDDSDEGIVSSLFIHNSYDLTESARFSIGGMRQVCSNGMIIGKILEELVIRHDTRAISDMMSEKVGGAYDRIASSVKIIEERIAELTTLQVSGELLKTLNARFGENRALVRDVLVEAGIAEPETPMSQFANLIKEFGVKSTLEGIETIKNQYDLYNMMTNVITYQTETNRRYQSAQLRKVGQIFEL